MCTFGYLKMPDIILSLVSSQKLDWTHTFGTYSTIQQGRKLLIADKIPYKQKRSKEKGFKDISDREARQLKITAANKQLLTSKEVFTTTGVESLNKWVPLTNSIKDQLKFQYIRINVTYIWAKDNMKTYFRKVVFIKKSRFMLDKPDDWKQQYASNGDSKLGNHDVGWNS